MSLSESNEYLGKAKEAIAAMKSYSEAPGNKPISLATQAMMNLQLAHIESLYAIEEQLDRITEILEPGRIGITVEPGFPLKSVKAVLDQIEETEDDQRFVGRYPDKTTERD